MLQRKIKFGSGDIDIKKKKKFTTRLEGWKKRRKERRNRKLVLKLEVERLDSRMG